MANAPSAYKADLCISHYLTYLSYFKNFFVLFLWYVSVLASAAWGSQKLALSLSLVLITVDGDKQKH
jgi:hypothetical protein